MWFWEYKTTGSSVRLHKSSLWDSKKPWTDSKVLVKAWLWRKSESQKYRLVHLYPWNSRLPLLRVCSKFTVTIVDEYSTIASTLTRNSRLPLSRRTVLSLKNTLGTPTLSWFLFRSFSFQHCFYSKDRSHPPFPSTANTTANTQTIAWSSFQSGLAIGQISSAKLKTSCASFDFKMPRMTFRSRRHRLSCKQPVGEETELSQLILRQLSSCFLQPKAKYLK